MTPLPDSALDLVPVFPLPHVVLFPDAVLPLHIFEPRYRKMLADCLAGSGALVIAQIDRNDTARIADVAGAGRIVDHQQLPDGRSNIVVAGCARVRLDAIVDEELPLYPYKRARARRLVEDDSPVSESDRAGLLATATMFVTEVKKHDPTFRFEIPGGHAAGSIADLCAFQLVVDAAVRQAILEELDPRARVRRVMSQLALQHGAMIADTKADRGGWGGAPS
jgi:ATP-dependent Lon protease